MTCTRTSSQPQRIIIESPYRASTEAQLNLHILYARAAVRDSVIRGEAPIASHLLFTQPDILDDSIPEERTLSMAAGLAWLPVAHAMAVYVDFGLSAGMKKAINLATDMKLPILPRSLPPDRIASIRAASTT